MKGALILILLVLSYSQSAYTVPSPGASPSVVRALLRGPPPPSTPCKTPMQWEGRFSEWNHNAATNNRYTISFDGFKKRKWIEEEQKSMRPGRRLFKFLILFEEQITYKIDLTYNRCSKIPTEPWRNFSIPPSALFEDQYLIGGPEGNLDVSEWSDRQPARHRESWIGGFTEKGCWPVFDIFTFTNDTVSIAYTTRFFDLQPGIKNMSVFDVPELCKNLTAGDHDIPNVPPTERPPWWERYAPTWLKKMFGVQRVDNVSVVNNPEVDTTEGPEPEVPIADNEAESKLPTNRPTKNYSYYQKSRYFAEHA
ncbi:mammalian ependymin-related protein 1-like [Patiria miniata]|uniref:Uncharacterized protein n=1 Tax=Patiria miniata TaxID=46514 RepID=A0A913ZAK4_PATMI|nr:mammalian ependymin-related protein 1-like [Patiria miniata]